jgi:hypothetical protein
VKAITSPIEHALAVAELMSRLSTVTYSDEGRATSGVLKLS